MKLFKISYSYTPLGFIDIPENLRIALDLALSMYVLEKIKMSLDSCSE